MARAGDAFSEARIILRRRRKLLKLFLRTQFVEKTFSPKELLLAVLEIWVTSHDIDQQIRVSGS